MRKILSILGTTAFLLALLANLALGYPRTVMVEDFTNWG